MRRVLGVLIVLVPFLLLAAHGAQADGIWLDNGLVPWNTPGMAVPSAPPTIQVINPECDPLARPVELADDQQVVAAGWKLVGAYQGGWGVNLIIGTSGYDGMCRPLQYQDFVFVNGVFAGTLSPVLMDSRTDGALGQAQLLIGGTGIAAEFLRYNDSDPLCCPSRRSSVSYTIDDSQGAPVVTATDVSTSPLAGQEGSAVTGVLTYLQRSALPPDAVATVTLADVSRADAPSTVLAMQTISPAGQVPIAFSLSYDPAAIDASHTYAVSARITDGSGTLLFISMQSYRVITQGNPTSGLEIVLGAVQS